MKGSNCPHYDGEPQRRPAYQRLVKNQEISEGIAAEDSVALHYIGENLVSQPALPIGGHGLNRMNGKDELILWT